MRTLCQFMLSVGITEEQHKVKLETILLLLFLSGLQVFAKTDMPWERRVLFRVPDIFTNFWCFFIAETPLIAKIKRQCCAPSFFDRLFSIESLWANARLAFQRELRRNKRAQNFCHLVLANNGVSAHIFKTFFLKKNKLFFYCYSWDFQMQ